MADTQTLPDEIAVEVTAEHLAGFDPDHYEADTNPVSKAVLAALRASDELGHKLPENVGVDLTFPNDCEARVALWVRLGPPWDWYATLRVWNVEGDQADPIWTVMYGDEAPEPFTFALDMR